MAISITGIVQKLLSKQLAPVQYYLPLGDQTTHLNPLFGKTISMEWTGAIFCTGCGKKTPKSFGEGFCYPCFMSDPRASECILRPELCRAHLGEGRNPAWEQKHHNQPHIVYLALSSTVKVGVTRSTQVPTRWIDQGASKALVFAETPNRHIAGLIEMALKEHITDKTSWQKMLKNEVGQNTLLQTKERMVQRLDREFKPYVSSSTQITSIEYDVRSFPQKVVSINLDRARSFSQVFQGIKGQYFIFDEGKVINIRKYAGYEVVISF